MKTDECLKLMLNRQLEKYKLTIDDVRDKWNEIVSEQDIVYHLGDFAYTPEGLKWAEQLNGKKILIRGNYDEQFSDEELLKYFDKVYKEKKFVRIKDEIVQLNHYPDKGSSECFNLVGHIHSLWKVQRNEINVGCDAWQYEPVSLDTIIFTMNAIRKFYDANVFAGQLVCNESTKNKNI